MILPRNGGLLARLAERQTPPDWLSQWDIDFYIAEYSRTGFAGGLNWYRNIDRLRATNAFLSGAQINQPSLFIADENDTVVRDMYTAAFNSLNETMPGLTKKALLPGAGQWIQQERAAEITAAVTDLSSWGTPASVVDHLLRIFRRRLAATCNNSPARFTSSCFQLLIIVG